jgi:hypothetical protein
MLEPQERHRIYLRLGQNRRDRRLAAYIAADQAYGVNISKLIKELLYNYYTGTPLPTHAGPVVPEASEESRQAALSNKLKKLSFASLGEQ